jgi:hypothetical protein
MNDGIYILKTTDGFRVAYSKEYHLLVDLNEDCDYVVNGKVAKRVFENSECYSSYDDALKQAKLILLDYGETDDGICFIRYAQRLNYGDLTNGTNC